jgi:Icc-related predicted phosphoesterase
MSHQNKIFFSTDVHGATTLWKKWLKIPELYNVDILMLCGDLTGKTLIPIIDQGNGSHVVFYAGQNITLQTQEEIADIESKLADMGAYSLRCDGEKIQHLKNNHEEVEKIIKEKAQQRLIQWLDLLVTTIDLNKIKVIVMPGNDDDYAIDPVIRSYEDKGIIWCLDTVIMFDDLELISLAHVNPTPWDTPREASEKQMTGMIKKLVKQLRDPGKSIFNFHAPPYKTRIDLAPELDRNKKPITVGGQVCMIHAGSKAVRKAIETYQPLLGLHGHIHESSGVEKIKNTICINPGSEYGEGILHGYVIEVSHHKVQNYWRVEG